MSSPLSQLPEQLRGVWDRLGRVQRTVLVALLVLGGALAVVLLGWSRTPDYAVAYSGLEDADAAQIVERLKEQGISYELGANGSILVPRADVHEVRLSMAGAGLPTGGSIGFELFDGSSLGMTEFYQEVNYCRALEGELARTIASLDQVEQARVHLVLPEESLYTSQETAPTASVMLNLAAGATLSKQQVQSIRYLVAGSIEGLEPDNLTIVDTEGNTLAVGAEREVGELLMEASAQQIEAQLAYQDSLEAQLNAMLEQIVGPGRAVVRVNVDMDWDQVETVSELYSPDREEGVLRSAQEISESYEGTTSSDGGVPGVEANVGDAAVEVPEVVTDGDSGSWERQESTQNWELSRTEQRTVVAPGKVQRITVAAMVDSTVDAAYLPSIEQALSAAAGIVPERGDVLSVQAMPFNTGYLDEQAAQMEAESQEELYWTLGKTAALAIVLVVVLLYVRSILNTLRPRRMVVESATSLDGVNRPLLPDGSRAAALEGPDAGVALDPALAQRLAEQLARQSAAAPTAAAASAAAPDGGAQAAEGAEAADDALEDDDFGLDDRDESDEARRARERIERKIEALARTEPHQIAQVIREWLGTTE